MRGELSERSAQDGLASDLYAQIIETKSKLVKSGNIRKDKFEKRGRRLDAAMRA